ncbi:aminotransferase class V-fold PLP-dependent enzyme [Devosia sp. FJ2-5-3]|uniref:pyridoxal-phosphate-dependent aminotransferase family protein n=1 Tax=Devosia sp. FJ2-5-3 TaxID=2976680 RepID=UPI0023D7DF35|nr:aminotransferase class V-fold PLP-dependent enzyme [Devosia sp. FJ2-5-3]WEJ58101.1 aminotransferase class V-fold PLP-dependent enzyme [Devosia sp. FJ2-5-3]
MNSIPSNVLLDLPPFPPSRVAGLADRTAALLNTKNDVVIVQGEAILALEAAATSLGRPGLRALNIVTSPYGGFFGTWLERVGSSVTNLSAENGLPITLGAVEAAFASGSFDLVALVHAESATGILNPLEDIAALAKKHGALVVVDAVASIGGHPVEVDRLGIDIAVIGPQKALAGSAGLSMLSVSAAAWAQIEKPGATEISSLSLLDLKRNWLDKGRQGLPGMPSSLELHALDAALTRIEAEGIEAVIARHVTAANATREALIALGLVAFTPADTASNLATAVVLPPAIRAADALAALAPLNTQISASVGAVSDRVLRIQHTGRTARFEAVAANITALAGVLNQLGHEADAGAALARIFSAYNRTAA